MPLRAFINTNLVCVIFFLIGCKSYNDQALKIENKAFIDVNYPSIEFRLVGKEPIIYKAEISYKDFLIDTFSIVTNDTLLNSLKFSFQRLNDSIPNFTMELVNNSNILLRLHLYNKEHKIDFDTTLSYSVKIPPVVAILRVKGENITPTDFYSLFFDEMKLEEMYPKADKTTIKRAAMLHELIKSKTSAVPSDISYDNLIVLDATNEISIQVELDTLYKHSFIARYPSKSNRDYSDIGLEELIIKHLL